MSRRITVGLVAGLALLLAACEININYDLLLNADGSSELETEIVYDAVAAEMLGPPEAFLDELEEDTAQEIRGVSLLDASADSSDPDAQRVRILLGAEDPAALDALVDDTFAGHYREQESGVYELVLRVEAAEAEFGPDMDFVGGSMVVRHDGERRSVTGGEEVDSQTVRWDPTGPSDLRLVVDEKGAGFIRLGDADLLPPPDPERMYPPGFGEQDVESHGLQTGFRYPVSGGSVNNHRLQLVTYQMEVQREWCALQTPVFNSFRQEYSCLSTDQFRSIGGGVCRRSSWPRRRVPAGSGVRRSSSPRTPAPWG
jgi:hypothetical protein